MTTLADVFGVAYLVVSLASVLILRVALSNRDKPGSDGFALLVLGIMIAGSATGLQFIADGNRGSALAWNVVILGADFVSIGWFLFAAEFTNWRSVPRSVLAFLGIEVIVVQAFAWTNPAHHLVLLPATSVDALGFYYEAYGPVFWVHTAIAYVIISFSVVLLIRELLDTNVVRRKQIGIFLVSASVPLVTNLLYLFRLQPIDFTLTPIGFFIAELGFAWALYTAGFLDIVPVARKTAIKEMGDAFMTVDSGDRVVDYNRAARDLFNPDGDMTGVPTFRLFKSSIDIGGQFDDITDIETEITLNKDGEQRHYNLSTSPVRTDKSGTSHVIVLSDITSLKRREQELERTTDQLEQFAEMVSHDLRNPLNVATGRLQLAREECNSEHLERVEVAHNRMETLIEDLLVLAREGRPVEETEQITLSNAANKCWKVVDTIDATLIVNTDIEFIADVNSLDQLLENLFRNAIEHGGTDATIWVGKLKDRPGFYIADDGPGINEEDREKVLESGYSTARDGTGFGLAIVSEIADAHEWTITITNGHNGGARFEFAGIETEE